MARRVAYFVTEERVLPTTIEAAMLVLWAGFAMLGTLLDS